MADLDDKRARRKRPGEGFTIGVVPTPGVPIYEELLNRDPRWALSEGSRHFEEDSAVFKALHNITSRLKTLGIPYAVLILIVELPCNQTEAASHGNSREACLSRNAVA